MTTMEKQKGRGLLAALAALVLCAAAAVLVVPRGLAAHAMLATQDDPGAIAERALDGKFDSAVANREIAEALAAGDSDLAQSFVDLSADRRIAIDSALAANVKEAVEHAASAQGRTVSFARGLVTGVPSDGAALAGTAVGDLFVFGDIRDLTREGIHAASGEPVDKLVVGLAAVGVAITAGTYVTYGITAPFRAGLTLIKGAVRTGRVSAELVASLGRLLRQALIGPDTALAARGAREAVKVERAGGLLNLVSDVGRVERKAGTQAALDGLTVAQSEADMTRVATLAEKNGSKTRAILKLLGRGAIVLSAAAFDLATWILGAAISVFAFVSALKRATERMTERVLRRRKARRLARRDVPPSLASPPGVHAVLSQ